MQQGRKAMVSCTGRGVPFSFQVIQERFNHRNVDLFEAQSFRSDSLDIAAESQKQSKHVAVGLDRIGAHIALFGQVMGQKGRHVNGEIGRFHGSILLGMTSPKTASTRAVISGKNSAVR